MLWKYLWEYGVQSSDILLSDDFLSSHHIAAQLTVNWYYCEKLENWSIFKSANFKLDPELNLLNDHPLIPCRTINKFLSFFISHRDLTSLKKMKTPKWIEKKSTRMGEKREERENGNVNCNTTEQPSKNQSLRLKIIDCWPKQIMGNLCILM